MKYQLLLRDALRLTERTQRLSEIEDLRAAAHVMRVIPKAANDMMDVGRLQGFDVSRNALFLQFYSPCQFFNFSITSQIRE